LRRIKDSEALAACDLSSTCGLQTAFALRAASPKCPLFCALSTQGLGQCSLAGISGRSHLGSRTGRLGNQRSGAGGPTPGEQ
jgi:hypothetical protein